MTYFESFKEHRLKRFLKLYWFDCFVRETIKIGVTN